MGMSWCRARGTAMAVVVLAVAFVVSACGGGDPGAPADGSRSKTSGSSSSSTSGDVIMAEFGDRVDVGGGLTLTVSAPERFVLSEYAVRADKHGEPIRLDITVENDGSEPYDATESFVGVQSGTAEAGQVIDDEVGMGLLPPVTRVLPSRSLTWPVGFTVEDPSDVVVEVRLDSRAGLPAVALVGGVSD